MLMLEKRSNPSRGWTYASPIVAVILTMILGGIVFAILGKPPLETIRTIFYCTFAATAATTTLCSFPRKENEFHLT